MKDIYELNYHKTPVIHIPCKNNELDIKLIDVVDTWLIQEALAVLEGNLIPSLSERKIDLKAYSEKISKYGNVWCHYDCGKPVSILAGYCNDKSNYTAYLTILAVNEAYRSKKLGTSLMAEYELYAQKSGMKKSKLEVRKSNTSAQSFYKKHGYQIIGDASETSYYMEKIFDQSNLIGEGEEIYRFLYKVDTLFPVFLSEKENLKKLTEKILKNGLISAIRVDNELVAFVAGYANDFKNYMAYISIVATLPEYSGKGYGELAVKDFISKCIDRGMKAIHLYAVATNVPAIKMYQKLGFIDYKIENEPRPNDAHFILYLRSSEHSYCEAVE